MEQIPWEANRFAASQEIPLILWNPKIHYGIHNCPLPVPIQKQLDPVQTSTSHFLKIQLNIILPSTPGFPEWSLSLRFPHQNPVSTSPLRPYALHPPPISFFSNNNNNNNNKWINYYVKLQSNTTCNVYIAKEFLHSLCQHRHVSAFL